MGAPSAECRVLACLPPDESGAQVVLAEARRLADDLDAPLTVVQVYPAGYHGPVRPRTDAWLLRGGDSGSALRRFAARQGITHLVAAKGVLG